MPSTKYGEQDWSDILTEAISRRDDAKRVRALARKMGDAKVFLVRVTGPARFLCPHCRHCWTSQRGMVTLNLKKENLAKAWKQYCSRCDSPDGDDDDDASDHSNHGGYSDYCYHSDDGQEIEGDEPRFSPDEMQLMADHAVDQFLLKAQRHADGDAPRVKPKAPKDAKPHLRDLCEACRLGKCMR